MAYTISLEIFEGPLDLLLHLIQKNKIDIYNIPIAAITEQYLEHLQAMQELDLDMASEFLLMAATLLSIKAKMLLPQTTIQEEQEDNDDPRKELVDRLIEYQKYKKAAEKLKIKQHNQAMFYSRPLDPMYLEDALKRFNPLENISLEDFKNILSVVLTETEDGETVKLITKGTITVKEKIEYIEALLIQKPQGMLFQNLFTKNSSTLSIIVTFLALLELIYLKKVFVTQTSNFGPLCIYPITTQSED